MNEGLVLMWVAMILLGSWLIHDFIMNEQWKDYRDFYRWVKKRIAVRKQKKAIRGMFRPKVKCPYCGKVLVRTNYKKKGKINYFICFSCTREFYQKDLDEVVNYRN